MSALSGTCLLSSSRNAYTDYALAILESSRAVSIVVIQSHKGIPVIDSPSEMIATSLLLCYSTSVNYTNTLNSIIVDVGLTDIVSLIILVATGAS